MTVLFHQDVLAAFQAAGVATVVVGGVALNLRGVQRSTSDLKSVTGRTIGEDDVADLRRLEELMRGR